MAGFFYYLCPYETVHEMDSVVQACEQYLKALEIMEKHYEEKDLVGYKAKFMALVYGHLCTLFTDHYLHVQAVGFAKQAYEILIYLQNIPVGTQYEVHWFNSETGLEYSNWCSTTAIEQTPLGRKYIVLSFPSSIRNLNKHKITNTFGDAVFAIYRNASKKQEIRK